MRRVLIDTHVWLWMLAAPERLGADTARVLEEASNTIMLSAVSSWEISIKHQLGKLTLPEPPLHYVPSRMRSSGVTPLAVQHGHALATSELPRHHGDPFDRLLIAQATHEGVALLTADRAFEPYDIDVLWAQD